MSLGSEHEWFEIRHDTILWIAHDSHISSINCYCDTSETAKRLLHLGFFTARSVAQRGYAMKSCLSVCLPVCPSVCL